VAVFNNGVTTLVLKKSKAGPAGPCTCAAALLQSMTNKGYKELLGDQETAAVNAKVSHGIGIIQSVISNPHICSCNLDEKLWRYDIGQVQMVREVKFQEWMVDEGQVTGWVDRS
jgi:hypothetical protein